MICKNCGEHVNDGAVFCTECGAALDQQPNQPAQPLTNQATPQTEEEKLQTFGDINNQKGPDQKSSSNTKGSSKTLKTILIILLVLIVIAGITAAVTLIPRCTSQSTQSSGSSNTTSSFSSDTSNDQTFNATYQASDEANNNRNESWKFENGKFTVTNSSGTTTECNYEVVAKGDQAVRDYCSTDMYKYYNFNDALEKDDRFLDDIAGTSNWVELKLTTPDSSQTTIGTLFVADADSSATSTLKSDCNAQAKFIKDTGASNTSYYKNYDNSCRLKK